MFKSSFRFGWAAWLALFVVRAASGAETKSLDTVPDLTEGNIGKLTARILAQSQFSKQPFDEAVSRKFFDRYLDSLDGLHLLFLQSDVREFETYRDRLDELTLHDGDTTPAHIIFARFLLRVKQRSELVAGLLTNSLDFSSTNRFVPDRHELPRPKDLNEARDLWQQELRYEFLQEKLSSTWSHQSAVLGADTNGHWVVRTVHGKPDGYKLSPGPLQGEDGKAFGHLDIDKQTNVVIRLESTPERTGLHETKVSAGGNYLGRVALVGTNYAWIDFEKTNLDDVVKKIRGRYKRVQDFYAGMGKDEVLQLYLNSLAHVYDPHSDYFTHFQMEDFAMNMNLSLFGIGALLESQDDGYCAIKELLPGPAMKSKQIKVKDRIVAVGQGDSEPVDVVGMRLNKIVEMIRGPKGTTVHLVIIPADSSDDSVRKTVTIVRDEIKLEDKAAKARLIEVPRTEGKPWRLGVIDLPSFYTPIPIGDEHSSERNSTTIDVGKLLTKLVAEKVDGVILDLRRNGGGGLEEAVNLTGLFIKDGPVVQIKDANGDVMVKRDRDPSVLYDGPLIVLTSRFSASASEILAGALQDYDRALIVGDSSTHGKGTVQTLIELGRLMDSYHLAHSYDPGGMKLTIQKFYRPSGATTQLTGVLPDIVLPSINNYAKVGEKALDDPLPADEIPPASFSKVDYVKPYVPSLRKQTNERVSHEQDFVYVREDIDTFKKLLADKSVSLNEEQRRREKLENEARSEARIHEERMRPPTTDTVYELTLKNIKDPGLPLPLAHTNSVASATGAGDADDILTADLGLEEPPSIDVSLEESERILIDYIGLRRSDSHALSVITK